MALNINKTMLPGVLLIKPDVFEDHRGQYIEIYNEKDYPDYKGTPIKFVQDDISVSRFKVLRGVHGDHHTWKLISCLYGHIYLVVVAPNRLTHESFTISEHNRRQVLVPPSHGVGHVVLTDKAIFHYKQSTHYDRESQFTIKWNDPALAIDWPIKDPILSQRDS